MFASHNVKPGRKPKVPVKTWLSHLFIQKQPPEKKAALKNSAIFTGKHLCWSLSLIKLQAFKFCRCFALRPPTVLKRDSNTGVFL